jgi:hypothetical protein
MPTIQFRQALFWDTDPKKLDINKHAKYIIERIMDFGNDEEVRWMRQQYPKSLLAQVTRTSRVLHASSKTLWSLLTNQ